MQQTPAVSVAAACPRLTAALTTAHPRAGTLPCRLDCCPCSRGWEVSPPGARPGAAAAAALLLRPQLSASPHTHPPTTHAHHHHPSPPNPPTPPGFYYFGFSYGGPVIPVWGWPLIVFFTFTIALSLAEICSALPTSGETNALEERLRAGGFVGAVCFTAVLTLDELCSGLPTLGGRAHPYVPTPHPNPTHTLSSLPLLHSTGGVYFWSGVLGGEWGPLFSWVSGWLQMLGQASAAVCCQCLTPSPQPPPHPPPPPAPAHHPHPHHGAVGNDCRRGVHCGALPGANDPGHPPR